MELQNAPDFTLNGEFASQSSGGKVLFATDDFFAVADNMLLDSEPVFIADKFTEHGKWMDGWETRRKRIPGHDWCVIKLATMCVVRGILVDTAHFTGNYAPKFSVQAHGGDEDEALMPKRVSQIGTACSHQDLQHMKKLNSDKWFEILPMTSLQPGYEESRKNYFKIDNDKAWTHLRINIFPDGGIARFRVYGEARPPLPPADQLIDLVALLNGGQCIAYSNAHFGHPKNMIKPNKSGVMSDGWETARRLDRPAILEANENGTLKVPGEEWAIFKLGFPGKVSRVCIDTSHFKGNYPDSVKIEGSEGKTFTENSKMVWLPILKPSKMSAHKEHWFDCESTTISFIKVTMAPDGGISRIRIIGNVAK